MRIEMILLPGEWIIGTDVGDNKKVVMFAKIAADILEAHPLHESFGLS